MRPANRSLTASLRRIVAPALALLGLMIAAFLLATMIVAAEAREAPAVPAPAAERSDASIASSLNI